MTAPMKSISKSEVLVLKDQIAYQEGQVESKTLAQNSAVSVTLFSFDKNEEISAHAAGGDAFVTCLDGVGKITIDGADYSEKLTEIIKLNGIKSVTVVRMEVPCCGGLEAAAKKALQASGKFIPWQIVTISIDGKILNR